MAHIADAWGSQDEQLEVPRCNALNRSWLELNKKNTQISVFLSCSKILQEENALLRRELMMNREVGQGLMDDLHKGVISSEEVADKFGKTSL